MSGIPVGCGSCGLEHDAAHDYQGHHCRAPGSSVNHIACSYGELRIAQATTCHYIGIVCRPSRAWIAEFGCENL